MSGQTIDDMTDMPENLAPDQHDARLVFGLEVVRAQVFELYQAADARAMANQKMYRRIVPWMLMFATSAVILAIAQMWTADLATLLTHDQEHRDHVYHIMHTALIATESIAIALTAALALWAFFGQFHKKWLLERHLAERCRLLKFDMLRRPALWCQEDVDLGAWGDTMAERVAALEQLHAPSFGDVHDAWAKLEHWTRDMEVPRPPNRSEMMQCAGADISPFLAYYLDRRLNVQRQYFERAIKAQKDSDHFVHKLPTLLFVASVVAAFAHIVLAVATGAHAGWLGFTSTVMIFLAAALPVLGAGIRVYRGAFEFARNAMRFDAKLIALNSYAKRLGDRIDVTDALETVWNCEQIIESEHREWLRLMTEVEWMP